jgi:isoleucyl-tRNA synthetase
LFNPTMPSYKDTILLPRTAFPMKANLPALEPAIRARWEAMGLYRKILDGRRDADRFILHDGPPYANGDVHVGTGQNKVLKDIVVRYHTLRGFFAPYVPGWDCHGLPIEHKVAKELGERAKTIDKAELRRLCEAFARKYVDIQRRQFKSLGVLGDWERPYLTIDPAYEVSVIEVFEDLWRKGHVQRRRKPIHWCIQDRTALAEAELEYQNLPSPSIYLAFELLLDSAARLGAAAGAGADLLVWTTTPWTLPADVAVAVHPDLEYAVVRLGGARSGRLGIIAPQRIEECGKRFPIGERTGTVRGKDLVGLQYRQPIDGRPCPVIPAGYVTVSDGTGLVHTAPGHGEEDYRSGIEHVLPVLSPVDEEGRFTAEAGPYAGAQVFEANPRIVEDLRKRGTLLADESFSHDYPCCWRCKQPVIFRAAEQWFIAVDHAEGRERALEAVRRVRWVPAWGEVRISSMLQERPDWCVSRQRSWGVPIPAFFCASCGQVLMNDATFAAVKRLFAQGGANAWFTTNAADILLAGTTCPACRGSAFRKETDIFDVWFESAASHRGVCRKHPDLGFPADVYLEGTDQHRGWFQVSLLASLFSIGSAPFRTVVTHGFLVDARTGDKLSKSGFLIPVEEVASKLGADILRLWIASINFSEDLPMSWEILQERMDPYRKIRNTFRYLLGSVGDFDPARHTVPDAGLLDIDRWALATLRELVRDCADAYERYEFHRVYQYVYQFCVVELSAFYLDVLKDRLYCDARDSRERRSAQTAIYRILADLAVLFSPVLTHTMEEVWGYIPGSKAESVHLARWPDGVRANGDTALLDGWDEILAVREDVNRVLEKLRAEGTIGKSVEAGVELYVNDPVWRDLLSGSLQLLETICMVSEVRLLDREPEGASSGVTVKKLSIRAFKSPHPRCERCWNHKSSVGQDTRHPVLCGRCARVVAGEGMA